MLVDTKTGRKAVRGRVFVDATGDGDVAANAGLPFDFGRESDGRVQGMTMMFEVRGVDAEAARATSHDHAMQVFENMKEQRDQGRFPPFNEAHMFALHQKTRQWVLQSVSGVGEPIGLKKSLHGSPKKPADISIGISTSGAATCPPTQNAEISQMGFGMGVRESRRIRGLKTLDAEMVVNAVKQPDAIGHGFWPVDIHDPKGSGHTTYSDKETLSRPPVGETCHIPLGMCLNTVIPNLAVVGRCASATHQGIASVRLQSHCMVMGQGLGTCAAMALEAGVDMSQVDLHELQSTLRKDGVYLEDVPA